MRAPAKPRLDPTAEEAAAVAETPPDETGGTGGTSPGAAGAHAPGPRAPGDDTGMAGAGLETAPQPAYVPAEPEPVRSTSPDDLRGQTEIQVMNILGSPASTRADGTSTIWSYRTTDCSLDIYFFLDVADNQRRALSYELVASQTGMRAAERCYQALSDASAPR